MLNMKKRGISPLIATVVLVGIVMVISVFLWFWYNNYISEQLGKAQIDLNQACTQDVGLRIETIDCSINLGNATDPNDDMYVINAKILNTGSRDITKLIFNVENDDSSKVVESGKVITAGFSLETSVQVNKVDLGTNPKEIEIIPGITSGQTLKNCVEQSEIAVINICN